MNKETLQIYPPSEVPAAEARGEPLVYGARHQLEALALEVAELRQGDHRAQRKAELLIRQQQELTAAHAEASNLRRGNRHARRKAAALVRKAGG